MRKKHLFFATGVILLLGVLFFIFLQPSLSSSTPETSVVNITQEELSFHNSAEDCWVAYQGKVYDMTHWLTQHPGGSDAIAPYCGTGSEFEVAFTQKHGTLFSSKLVQVATYMGDFVLEGSLRSV